MALTEYTTSTLIDSYHASLPLFSHVYKPSSRGNDKPLILLLHGAGGDHRQFDDVIPTLIENGYYTMVCDLRYHGRSQSSSDQDEPVFDFTIILQDLDRALDWFRKQHKLIKLSIVLGGISMGGMIAQTYAQHILTTYDCVKIHALVGIGCAHIQIKHPAIPWMAFYKSSSYCDAQAMIPAARKSILDSAYSHIGKSKAASSLCLVDDKMLFYCFKACANAPSTSNHDLFPIPQLLLRGQYDIHTKDVMEAWYDDAQKTNPANTAYKVIPCAGHLVTIDKGRVVGDYIITFLTSQ